MEKQRSCRNIKGLFHKPLSRFQADCLQRETIGSGRAQDLSGNNMCNRAVTNEGISLQ
jgi:hypothetical protein